MFHTEDHSSVKKQTIWATELPHNFTAMETGFSTSSVSPPAGSLPSLYQTPTNNNTAAETLSSLATK
jgi:hypothetical protein